MYSNGVSEEILGKAIKKFNLPRDEIVVLTKVCVNPNLCVYVFSTTPFAQVFFPVKKDHKEPQYSAADLEAHGYVNQHGLSRKVP